MHELEKTHDELLQAIGAAHTTLKRKELTTFFPIKGRQAKGELMVVGRAVNGWATSNCFFPADAANPVERRRILDVAIRRSTATDNECPLQWVYDRWGDKAKGRRSNLKYSQFWSVIRRVVSDLKLADVCRSDWPSTLIQSELYKVAPCKRGNPSTRLIKTQKEICKKHLGEEIALWKPKRILFLTGKDWCSSFLLAIGEVRERPTSTKLVQLCGSLTERESRHTAEIVVAVHPQRRSPKQVASEIVSCFSSS